MKNIINNVEEWVYENEFNIVAYTVITLGVCFAAGMIYGIATGALN